MRRANDRAGETPSCVFFSNKLSAYLNQLSAYLMTVRRGNSYDAVCDAHPTAEWFFTFAPPEHNLLILVLLLTHGVAPNDHNQSDSAPLPGA
jgi:hypothetical protein